MSAKETISASKAKFNADDAWKLASAASKVIVARGKNVQTFDMKNGAIDKETLLKAMLGPTGNLRAPAVRKGKTLYIGFNEDVYAALV
ncbi:MAG: hypothetical protein H6818_19760 [Phycisphaerales bacterium]|nr:hypothetical protein [Phycisphaerales bacterium]